MHENTLYYIIVYSWLAFFAFLQDSNSNPEQFPRNFTQGVGDGIWWSLATMTTVG